MKSVTAIVFIVVAGFCCIECNKAGDYGIGRGLLNGQEYDDNITDVVLHQRGRGSILHDKATDAILHRRKRGLGSILVYGTSVLLKMTSLGITLAQAITGGCATHPSICSDKDEIEKIDREIKNLRAVYDDKYLDNKKQYLDLSTANTNNAYIMYYMNETIRAVQSLEDYQDKISKALEIELNEMYQRFQANPNSTVYLASVIGELEYSLSDIHDMVERMRESQIIGLVVQYLIEFSVSRFVNAFSKAYNQVAQSTEDIFGNSMWTAMFRADPDDAAIIMDPNHPRWKEVMAKNGVPTEKARITLKEKFKFTPKVLKQMGKNIKGHFENLGESLKKWKRIRNWQGFKGKLRHSLKGPIKKFSNVKKFFTSSSSRKYFVKNYKLSWSQGGMMALGAIGDIVQVAVQTAQWATVAREMSKAKHKYREYRDNLKRELRNIIDQTKEIAYHWPQMIQIFKNLSLSFKSIIDDAKKHETFSDVLGLPKLPVDVSTPFFSVDFESVTKENLRSAQGVVIEFMKDVDNDVTRVADQLRAREILYENVLKMTRDKKSVQDMLDASRNIYRFSPSKTIKDYGDALSKQDIVCTVSQLHRTMPVYDFYQLEPFRPRCNISTAEFSSYETAASLLRKEELMTSAVSHYPGNSLSTLLDLVHAAYRINSDAALRRFGSTITDQMVTCSVSKVHPKKKMFDFIILSPFRPDCSAVTANDFQTMKTAANTIRAASTAVGGALTICEQFSFCPCPASIGQTNGISEADVIELIKALRPKLPSYCGTTGCACVRLLN